MLFWELPDNKFFAFIPRSGSTAWGQAILDKYYPEKKKIQHHTASPNKSLAGPQYLIPHTRKPPEGAQIFGIIRNPIDRFCSGFKKSSKGYAVSGFINDLVSEAQPSKQERYASKRISGKDNIHIRSITDQFKNYVDTIQWHCHDNDIDLENLAKTIGLDKMPETLNKSESKPTLNAIQIKKLEKYYADDLALYLKIKNK